VWQYGSNFNPVDEGGEEKCRQDGVADQARIRGLDETGLNNIFIPQTREYKSIRNFLGAHSSANYDWIFDRMEGQTGYVKKRND